jgi:hypothetical protein
MERGEVFELAARVAREKCLVTRQEARRRQQPVFELFAGDLAAAWDNPGDAIAAGAKSTQAAATVVAQALARNDMTGLP